MAQSKVMDVDSAAKLVKDGDFVAVGGVGRTRAPMAMVRALIRHGADNLSLIGREVGINCDMLIGAGLVKEAHMAFLSLEEYGLSPNYRRAVESGRMKVREHACRSVMVGVRAAACGMPFAPIKGIIGSDLLKVNDNFKVIECPFTGEKLVAVKALKPDVTIVHAHRADAEGNIQVKGMRFEDEFMARAAKTTIVTVEEIVPKEQVVASNHYTLIPNFFVTAVVPVKYGAHPASLYRAYESDAGHISNYAKASQTENGFNDYLQKYVFGPKDQKSYIELVAREGWHMPENLEVLKQWA